MVSILIITKSVSIPLSELEFRFSRSGGPGGQNVNKVETRVELLFDVAATAHLREEERALVMERLGSRLDSAGVLHVVAGESRSQWKNRQTTVRRFIELLQGALKPRPKRVKTKTPRVAKQKRLDDKKRRGEKKRLRKIDL